MQKNIKWRLSLKIFNGVVRNVNNLEFAVTKLVKSTRLNGTFSDKSVKEIITKLRWFENLGRFAKISIVRGLEP